MDPIIILGILLALLFNFANGLNDAANSIATIIATKALSPLQAVLLAGVFPILVSRHDPRGLVADLMSTRVVSVEADDPVSSVLSLVNVTGFSAFPVMKRRQLVGMVSRRDLLSSGRSRRGTDGGLEVEAVMTTPAITLSPGEPVREAATMLCRHDISRAPVMDGTKVVGILDRHDVLRGLALAEN